MTRPAPLLTYHLDFSNLSCARGDRALFHGLSRSVESGELLHVTGSNGSGKTTLLRTLVGLSRPVEGEIRWCGRPVRELGDEYQAALAYVGHLDGIQGELTPTENLRLQACTADSEGLIKNALDRMGLAAYTRFPAKILSQGQRRRLALARLLVLKRPLWVLDEPLTALDVDSCALTISLFEEQLGQGGLILLSSHQQIRLKGKVGRLSLERPSGARSRRQASSPAAISDHRVS